MRCEDVIRELAAPTDMRDAAASADHLSRCPSCAALADRAARLDRLWEATRPSEPRPRSGIACGRKLAHSLDALKPIKKLRHRLRRLPKRLGRADPSSTSRSQSRASCPRSCRSRLWQRSVWSGLSRVAAVLLVAGLTWWLFVPLERQLPRLTSGRLQVRNSSDNPSYVPAQR